MRITLLLVSALCVASNIAAQKPKKKPPTSTSTVLIIDPGHGGQDPGSFAMFQNQRVVEDEYVFDVARRVERIAKERKMTSFMTISGNKEVRSGPPRQIFTDERNEHFAQGGQLVRAGTHGLEERLTYGNSIGKRYPKHRKIWISIHFDVVGSRTDVNGVRIIHGRTPGSQQLAETLAKSFGKSGRMRAVGPIAETGDKRYGLRRLYVLGSRNQADAKVLIELGNFRNEHDLYRIRDPKVREAYARAIVNGIKK